LLITSSLNLILFWFKLYLFVFNSTLTLVWVLLAKEIIGDFIFLSIGFVDISFLKQLVSLSWLQLFYTFKSFVADFMFDLTVYLMFHFIISFMIYLVILLTKKTAKNDPVLDQFIVLIELYMVQIDHKFFAFFLLLVQSSWRQLFKFFMVVVTILMIISYPKTMTLIIGIRLLVIQIQLDLFIQLLFDIILTTIINFLFIIIPTLSILLLFFFIIHYETKYSIVFKNIMFISVKKLKPLLFESLHIILILQIH